VLLEPGATQRLPHFPSGLEVAPMKSLAVNHRPDTRKYTTPVAHAQTPAEIQAALDAALAKYKTLQGGKNADYIPALAKVDYHFRFPTSAFAAARRSC
jgi:hypothetical protein